MVQGKEAVPLGVASVFEHASCGTRGRATVRRFRVEGAPVIEGHNVTTRRMASPRSDVPPYLLRDDAASDTDAIKTDRGAAPSPSLAIHMMASFRVAVNGEDVTARLGGKARSLLKILASHRDRILPRDALMEMLWPDTDPVTGGVSLKVAAHNLRSILEPGRTAGTHDRWVVFRDGTYGLNRDAKVWIDTESLERHWRRGTAFQAAQEIELARREYREAERLYAGDLLEEDIYDDWTIIRREQLRDVYLEIVSNLAELAMQNGDARDAIRYCHKIIDADPCREDAYRMLMQCHGALNQHARAGAWYAVCRTMLKREIGASPGTDTVRAFESLFP